MSKETQFQVIITENDINDDNLCVWIYPSAPLVIQSICNKQSLVCNATSTKFLYLKYKYDWIYILSSNARRDILPDVKHYSLSIISKEFNIKKYKDLLNILNFQYNETGDPTKVLEGYLSVYTTNVFTNKIGKYDSLSYNNKPIIDKLIANDNTNPIKELVEILSLEFIILWNAILLKKRVLIYSDNIEKILELIQLLPLLCSHRNDYSILRPIATSDSEIIEDLSTIGVYIAGTTDLNLTNDVELYDVLISYTDRSITVSPQAISSMKMCSIHRDIASSIVDLKSDNEILSVITKKTNNILNQLKSLSSDSKLTEDTIRSSSSNESTQLWLIRLANAEGLL